MAKGLDKSNERKAEVSSFGKDLAKRCKSKCELCEAANVKLNIYEIPPVKDEPDFHKCIMICDECLDKVERFSKMKENDLRFLGNSVWSETPIIQALSVYLLRQLKDKYSWVPDTLENVYLDEDAEELIGKIDFLKK